MSGSAIGLVSLLVSVAAVTVSIRNMQRNRQLALNSSSLPVVAAIFQEYRSVEFRAHLTTVFEYTSSGVAIGSGMDAVPDDCRDSLYAVCYFFDYIGVMVAFELAHQDIVIGPLCTQIIRTWDALEPLIESERAHRTQTYPADASPGFLNYFQFLVQLVRQSGGRHASVEINRRLKYRSFFA